MGLILPGIRVLVRKDDGRWRDMLSGNSKIRGVGSPFELKGK